MKLNNLINYAIENKFNDNLECELKFGKYNRLSSNISKQSFVSIYNRIPNKKYTAIYECIYKTESDSVRKREYIDVDIKQLYRNLHKMNNEQINTHINKIFEKRKTMRKEYTTKQTAYKGFSTPKYKAKINIEKNSDMSPEPIDKPKYDSKKM